MGRAAIRTPRRWHQPGRRSASRSRTRERDQPKGVPARVADGPRGSRAREGGGHSSAPAGMPGQPTYASLGARAATPRALREAGRPPGTAAARGRDVLVVQRVADRLQGHPALTIRLASASGIDAGRPSRTPCAFLLADPHRTARSPARHLTEPTRNGARGPNTGGRPGVVWKVVVPPLRAETRPGFSWTMLAVGDR